jgi:hypothetical protein
MEGWVHSEDGVRCVLLLDGDRVVGAGVYGVSLPQVARPHGFASNEIGFIAVAPRSSDTYRAVGVVGADEQPVLLEDVLQEVDAPVHPAQPTASGDP